MIRFPLDTYMKTRTNIKKENCEENKKKPLSDQKIVLALEVLGINLARRTVSKYREQLRIYAYLHKYL